MTITIWHNPRCGKSRQTLELLHARGIEPTVREYLKQPPSKAEVEALIAQVGGDATALRKPISAKPISPRRSRLTRSCCSGPSWCPARRPRSAARPKPCWRS
jgi:arsenate reductase